MKNKIKYLILLCVLNIMFIPNVMASSLSIWANVSSTTVNQKVSISVAANGLTGKFKISSSNDSVLSGGDTVWIENDTGVYTFTAKGVGSATITVTALDVSDDDGNEFSVSKSVTVNVVEASKPSQSSGGNTGGSSSQKKTYSSNNNLKGLSVSSYNITPEFSKDNLEYSLEVENNIDKVTINAEKEDNTARVSGTGEKELAEGINKFEIKVEAENGNVKTYVVNITRKELDPIIVTVSGKTYTVVRKEEAEEIPLNYEKSSVKMGDEEVLAYINNKTKNILVLLKDEEGNVKFYNYDEKTGKYTIYNNIEINGTSLKLVDMPKSSIPSGYSKVTFKYNDDKIDGYQFTKKGVTYAADDNVKGSSFYLVYAVNEETGKEGLYVYDSEENTIQRYNEDLILYYQNKLDKKSMYLYIAIAASGLILIGMGIVLFRKGKNKKRR